MPVTDEHQAKRVARAIVSDIVIYNKVRIEEGIKNDNLFELLKETIEEGRTLYQSRVPPEFYRRNFYGRALVDKLLKAHGNVRSNIW
jgi:hypothetical protein